MPEVTRPILDFEAETNKYKRELQRQLGNQYKVYSVTILTDPNDFSHQYMAKVSRKRT